MCAPLFMVSFVLLAYAVFTVCAELVQCSAVQCSAVQCPKLQCSDVSIALNYVDCVTVLHINCGCS